MRALRGWPLAWFLLALAFAIRLLSLGSYPLMDTTEARYGEVARKMAELGDWITPWYDVGVPFWEQAAAGLLAQRRRPASARRQRVRQPPAALVAGRAGAVAGMGLAGSRRSSAGADRLRPAGQFGAVLRRLRGGDDRHGPGPGPGPDHARLLAGPAWRGGNPAPRGLADVPRPRPRAAGERAADADPRRTADRPVGLAGVALARALAGPAMDPRKPADAPGGGALVPAGGVEDAGLPRVLPARRALAALRHRRLGRRPLRQCPRLSLRQRLAVPAGRRVSLEPLVAAAALAGLAPARGGGRWRRLAQALLAVLGTGAVPVLHLRRQRPLDLRAARPAGPGVARRRPAARAAGAAAPGCGVAGWPAWR